MTPDSLERRIRQCRICRDQPFRQALPHEPRPILRLSDTARVMIASQAPGARAHASGIPFDDASGERLRDWLGTEPALFYDASRIGIVPMGFCFPGQDAAGGDLPPRPECRARWHDAVFAAMPQVELIVTIGLHAARYHLARSGMPQSASLRMSDLVTRCRDFGPGPAPRLIPLPHPSWRNSAWLNRNPWFEIDVLPFVRHEVARALGLPARRGPCSDAVQTRPAPMATRLEERA